MRNENCYLIEMEVDNFLFQRISKLKEKFKGILLTSLVLCQKL